MNGAVIIPRARAMKSFGCFLTVRVTWSKMLRIARVACTQANMARMPILRSVPASATALNMSGMSFWLMRAIVLLAAASARKRVSDAMMDKMGDVLVLVVLY